MVQRNVFEPTTHVRWRIEMMCDAWEFLADRHRDAVEIAQQNEYVSVRDIVSDKNWATPGEWRVCHQFAHAGAFIKSRLLDFDHRLAGKHLDPCFWKARPDGRYRAVQLSAQVRRLTIMQRDRIALVLKDNAGMGIREGFELPFDFRVERRVP